MASSSHIGPPKTVLARVLFEQNVTRTALAEATGIHLSEISRIVNRGMDPGHDGAHAIARVLHRTVSECGWPHYDREVAA
jgi:plasmid maintenance system antidote protein VapI